MLMNLHKHVWTEALQMDDFREEGSRNQEKLKRLVGLAEGYEKRVKEETELTKDQLKTRYVGKVDPKKRELLDCFQILCANQCQIWKMLVSSSSRIILSLFRGR